MLTFQNVKGAFDLGWGAELVGPADTPREAGSGRGQRTISEVEASLDSGKSWRAARLRHPNFEEEAVRLARESRKSRALIAKDLGISEQFLYAWMKQADLDSGRRADGLTTEEHAEVQRLRREVRILREERDILQKPRPSLPRTSSCRLRHHPTRNAWRVWKGINRRSGGPSTRSWAGPWKHGLLPQGPLSFSISSHAAAWALRCDHDGTGAFAVHEAIESANGHALHSYRGAPDHAMAPMDDLLRRKGKPPRKFDLAVHPQANRRCEEDSGGNCVLKITPRCFGKPRELTGPKGMLAGLYRLPQSLDGMLSSHGCVRRFWIGTGGLRAGR